MNYIVRCILKIYVFIAKMIRDSRAHSVGLIVERNFVACSKSGLVDARRNSVNCKADENSKTP